MNRNARDANRNRNARVRDLAGVKRYRNGRLALDALSRRQMSTWRMIPLDGDWYERERLRAELAALGAFVPQTRRRLREEELARIRDAEPWKLRPW